jgi:ATP-dependent Clp protease protease subunit
MEFARLEKPDMEGKGLRSLERSLIRARTILVSEAVSDKLARRVSAQLLVMQEEDASRPISVYINSPGGSADSGFALYDMLRFVRPPVRTIVSGLCASAAILILLATDKARRFSMPNSRFLLHQPSTTVMGAASDIGINAKEIMKLKDRYNAIVAAETGKTVERINQDADRDFWLSAGEALEYGLVGKVVRRIDEVGK